MILTPKAIDNEFAYFEPRELILNQNGDCLPHTNFKAAIGVVLKGRINNFVLGTQVRATSETGQTITVKPLGEEFVIGPVAETGFVVMPYLDDYAFTQEEALVFTSRKVPMI